MKGPYLYLTYSIALVVEANMHQVQMGRIESSETRLFFCALGCLHPTSETFQGKAKGKEEEKKNKDCVI